MHLVVISHYASRSIVNLQKIVAQVLLSSPGIEIEVCIVANVEPSVESLSEATIRISYAINRTIEVLSGSGDFDSNKKLPRIHIHTRQNSGMNIGAWDHGWRIQPSFDTYLFIQDEVIILQENWYSAFLDKASNILDTSTPFLIGETWNSHWQRSWESLRNSRQNYDIDVGGATAPRVDYYLYNFKKWGIDYLDHGGHLRSIVWFTDKSTLERIGGFPVGRDYHDCIASEISVSVKVRSIGGSTMQLTDLPFSYIWHPEWRRDGISKLQ